MVDNKIVFNTKEGRAKIMDFIIIKNGSNGPNNALRVKDCKLCPSKSLRATKNCKSAVTIYNTVFDLLQIITIM